MRSLGLSRSHHLATGFCPFRCRVVAIFRLVFQQGISSSKIVEETVEYNSLKYSSHSKLALSRKMKSYINSRHGHGRLMSTNNSAARLFNLYDSAVEKIDPTAALKKNSSAPTNHAKQNEVILDQIPSSAASHKPSLYPSAAPSLRPSSPPSITKTDLPSMVPTRSPSSSPSFLPTISPSSPPTMVPTTSPSSPPTKVPTISPSLSPSMVPTISPSLSPSMVPTISPSLSPTEYPSMMPTQAKRFPYLKGSFSNSDSAGSRNDSFLGPLIGIGSVALGVVALMVMVILRKKPEPKLKRPLPKSQTPVTTPKEKSVPDQPAPPPQVAKAESHAESSEASTSKDETTVSVEHVNSSDLSTLYDSPSQKADEHFFEYVIERQRTNATNSSQLSAWKSLIACGGIAGVRDEEGEDLSSSLESGEVSSTRQTNRDTSLFGMFFGDHSNQDYSVRSIT